MRFALYQFGLRRQIIRYVAILTDELIFSVEWAVTLILIKFGMAIIEYPERNIA